MSEITELLQTYYKDKKAWNADYVCLIFSFFDSYFHQILKQLDIRLQLLGVPSPFKLHKHAQLIKVWISDFIFQAVFILLR